jgi:hypothetical protein
VDRKKNKNMPIPTPQPNEKKEDFLQRCMSDEVMIKDYESPQRFAVCRMSYDEFK